MSLISFSFFLFLAGTLLVYYALPRFQKQTLLIASILFFLSASSMELEMTALLMLYIFVVTYMGAIGIEQTANWRNDLISAVSILALVAALFILKYAYNMGELILRLLSIDTEISWLQFVPVLGLSYFTLSAIGYLLDVRWKVYPAERDAKTVALFLYFFPQVVSGPVTRFQAMRTQLTARTPIEYENIKYGLHRMLWGYFKKLVVSERFALFVKAVYGNPGEFGGADILIATLCYAVQLYTDFSGCMDIVLGAAALFGIRLPENFHAPFFSKTLQEFWQRWHITLGLWFKDYVMYPIQISGFMVNLGKKCRKLFGKKAGKRVPFYLSMVVLWFLIGVWHGCTAYYFVASAIVPCTLLIFSDIVNPYLDKAYRNLPFQTDGIFWDSLSRMRTVLLICICWVFVCAGSVHAGMERFYELLINIFTCHILQIYSTTGLSKMGLLLTLFGAVLLVLVDYYEDKNISLYAWLSKRSFIFQTLVIYMVAFLVLVCGIVGKSEFIYFQF